MISAKLKSLGALALLSAPLFVSAAEEVNVYSLRQPFLMQPLFDAFTKETNINVNVVFAKTGLAERLKREGKNSPADLVLTTDLGNLSEIQESGVTQGIITETLTANIPTQYRDPNGEWYALTTRVRAIYASKDRVPEGAITTYEDLAKPEWKGKICTRSGKHPYNVALIASMIAHHGEEKTEDWLVALKSNLAQKPQGNDRAQVKAIKEGVCDLSLGNSYYYGNMLTDPEQSEWAAAVRITFPNQSDRGAHVNISGVALTKSSPNKSNAIKLMEFLTDDLAQRMYSEQNYEYPVKPGVPASALVSSWGQFKADPLPLTQVEKYRAAAVKLVDKVNFDG